MFNVDLFLSVICEAELADSKHEQMLGSAKKQSCNEDSSKILGEGRWYWIHDFVATFGVNGRPIYMALCS